MKRHLLFLTILLAGFSLQAQNNISHYWTVGLNSSTKFFFATYYPGGSNFFTLDGAYTHSVGRNWQLGGGVGIGGATSTKQVYRGLLGDTIGSNDRNPYVIPLFARAKYLFDDRGGNTWFLNMDVGYMFGFVRNYSDKPTNYYCAYFSPTFGHQFSKRESPTKISVGVGLNTYMEGREQEYAPYEKGFNLQLDFLAYVTFDFGVPKKQ